MEDMSNHQSEFQYQQYIPVMVNSQGVPIMPHNQHFVAREEMDQK